MEIPAAPDDGAISPSVADPELLKRFRRALAETNDALERLGFQHVPADTRDPVAMAHRLLTAPTTSSAFAKLWEMGRLALSVEAIALRPEFWPLFSDAEREVARNRLLERGFFLEA